MGDQLKTWSGAGELEHAAGDGGDLAGDADVGEAVAAVAGDLDVEADVARGEGDGGFDGETGEGEGVLGLFGGNGRGDGAGAGEVFVQPADGDLHREGRVGGGWWGWG